MIGKFLDNQQKELAIEQERLRVRNKELENEKYLASKSIEAQLDDRSQQREFFGKLFKAGCIFVGIIVFMLVIFGAFVVVYDKEALLSEIMAGFFEMLKYMVGAVIGYLYAKSGLNTNSGND